MRSVCWVCAGMLGFGMTSEPGSTWLHVGMKVSLG